MLNYENAKRIDVLTGADKDDLELVKLENILNQLSMQSTNSINIDNCIHIRPQLLLNDVVYNETNTHAGLKVNRSKSKFNLKIESLITNDVYYIDSKQNSKIKTPFRNKNLFFAGQMLNRKFNIGINYVPKESEGVRLDSKAYSNLQSDSNLNFKTKVTIKTNNIFDKTVEEMEYRFRYNNWRDNNPISSDLFKYLQDKYIIYPYKVTETWQLAFEIIVNSKEQKKLIKFSEPLEISYYLWVLKYSNEYINNIIDDDVLFDIAIVGNALNCNPINHSLNLSKLGKIYKVDNPMSNVYISGQYITKKDENHNIKSKILLKAKVHEIPYNYEFSTNKNELSQLHFYYPKVVSMVPVMKQSIK
ncbi:hypothetical protein [Staphylococcus hyicus]|uniref:hypothetical protein n=1 Tax=Staphylococcus hyicus TaxID=1284 RepID=UPI003132E8CD